MVKLKIEYLPTDALKLRQSNPRTHSSKQIDQIAKSIEHFDFINPILIDAESVVIAGQGRLMAARQLRLVEVPTVRLDAMSPEDLQAYVIADNRLAEKAGWDRELLAIELQHLSELEIDYDVTLTGFETPEIDVLVGELSLADQPDADPSDVVPEPPQEAVTEPGDVWVIGNHRLICGDSTKAATYHSLLLDEKAQMVFTDPPYNVAINGHVSGLGRTKHREFAMASGEMSQGEFVAFLKSVFEQLVAFSADGSLHFQCMDWRHLQEIQTAGALSYSDLKNICVWVKSNGGMGSLYRSRHEFVLVYKAGSAAHINNVELGKHGRNRTNVWEYPGVNSFGASRGDLDLHPTVKPTAMVADAIKDSSHRKGIILDAFAGSGTTLIAAHKTGRRGFGIEIDPVYCDIIVQRFRQLFKLEAVLESTDESFDAVAARRLVGQPGEAAE